MRRSVRTTPLALAAAAAVALAACSDQSIVEPESSEPVVTTAQQGLQDLGTGFDAESWSPRYMVVLKGKNTRSFEAALQKLGGRIFFEHGPTGITFVEGLDEAGADKLARVRGVQLVAEEPVFTLDEPVSVSAPEGAAVPASPMDPSAAFFFPRQWNMRVIEADQAWAEGRLGSSDVTVAILDTGIGYTHADLAGLVDLGRSISLLPDDDALVEEVFPGAHPIADLWYHGTHVAATVASNGLVAAGVTSGATLMGVKICSIITRVCPAALPGILYAVDNGADVINMSLGGAFTRRANPGFVSILNSIFNYAKKNGVTLVVSAGNESADLDRNIHPNQDDEMTHFPSLFKTYCDATHVICVSATGPTSGGTVGPWTDVDAPAVYTNFGRSAVDVAAPGGNIGGAVWAACSPHSILVPICQTGTFVIGINGTSMAAPHVSGLAALAVEDVGKNPAKVRAYIRNSADAIGGGNTPFYGKGRINVASATGTN